MLKEEARALAVEDSLNKNKAQTLYRGGGTASGRSLGKIIAVLTIFLVIGLCFVGSASAFAGGDGSSSNPYQIATASDLQSLTGYLNKYFILNNDIDCSAVTSWTLIGTQSSPFYGHLNGNNKTIKNLTFSNTSDIYSGIFGFIGGDSGYGVASISDCIFDNINNNSAVEYRANSVICGEIYSVTDFVTFTNVTVQNIINSITTSNSFKSLFVGNCGNNSKTSFVNCICKNSSLSNCYRCSGFIVSGAYAGEVKFENCSCENLSIEGRYDGVSCFIGYGDGNITFSNCIANNCLLKGSDRVGCFIGLASGSNTDVVVIDENCQCKNCVISHDSNWGYEMGCFIGQCYTGNLKISENASKGNGAKIINCYLSGNSGVEGGIVASFGSTDSSSCKIDGVVVSACTIKGTDKVGGVVGSCKSIASLSNPTVKNCTITATSGTASGVVGYWYS